MLPHRAGFVALALAACALAAVGADDKTPKPGPKTPAGANAPGADPAKGPDSPEEPDTARDFELKIDGAKYTLIYKGKQELHQVTGQVTLICNDASSLPHEELWSTWKPGEEKVIVDDRAKAGVNQVQMDLAGRVRIAQADTVSPLNFLTVPLQAQWDAATGKQVLFLVKWRQSEDFFQDLRPGQNVILKDAGNGCQISILAGAPPTHRIVSVTPGVMGSAFIVLRDVGGETEITIPMHAIKSILRSVEKGK